MRTLLCALMTALALVVPAAPAAHADVSALPAHTAGLGGDVVYDLAVLPSGRVILGGQFSSVGSLPRRNVGALLANGNADPAFAATVNGTVRAVAASADGSRVFIGGTFTSVNGVARQNLAALNAFTGALIGSWRSDTTGAKPTVMSLAVHGNRLWVGGKFDGIDGTNKQRLAAVDVSSGNPIDLHTWVNGTVNEVRIAPDGRTAWIAGEFTKIHGTDRPYLGGIDINTGKPTGFAPTGNNSRLITLAISPDGQWVYAADNSNYVIGYQPAVANAPRWSRHSDGNTQALAASATTLYIGGHFNAFTDDGSQRRYFASVNRTSGATRPWNPEATGAFKGGWVLVVNGTHLHAGGGFTQLHGVTQRLYARFDGTP